MLSLAVLLGLALRCFFWLDQGRPGVIFSGDADEYYRGAVHLYLDGSYYDEGQWLRPPLTSLFWAACFGLFGPSIPAILLAQCVLGAITPLLLGDSARRLFVSRRAGLVATWLGALYLPYAAIASQALSETIFIFAVVLSLWLLVILQQRGMSPAWLAALAGSAFGMAALARPVGLYALPLLLGWVVWQARRPGDRETGRPEGVVGLPKRPRVSLSAVSGLIVSLSPILLLAGFTLAVAPWTIRNYLVYDQIVLVDTNGGVSFWFGTIKDPAEQKMQDVWKATLPNSALRQRAALQLGIDNIRRDPGRWISRMRNKVVSLWQLETRLFAGNAATGVTVEEGSLAYALLADSQYLLLVLLALAAIVLAPSRERHWVLITWPLYGSLLSALTLGHPRLRLPLLVPLLIYAALPLAHPWSLRRRWQAAGWGRRLLAVGLSLSFLLLVYASAYRPFAAGQLWALWARLGGGRAALERATVADPQGFLPWIELGDAALQAGEPEQALSFYQRAAELAPRGVYSHARQIPLLLAAGDRTGAAAALHAIAAVDWDNNLLYAWAWDKLAVPAPQRLEMDGAVDLGSIRGFYRATDEGDTTLRWAMSRAQLRLHTQGNSTKLRMRLRAEQSDQPLDVSITVGLGAAQIGKLQVGTKWQIIELPLPVQPPGDIVVELRAPAPIRSLEQPYPRSVAVDWVEVGS